MWPFPKKKMTDTPNVDNTESAAPETWGSKSLLPVLPDSIRKARPDARTEYIKLEETASPCIQGFLADPANAEYFAVNPGGVYGWLHDYASLLNTQTPPALLQMAASVLAGNLEGALAEHCEHLDTRMISCVHNFDLAAYTDLLIENPSSKQLTALDAAMTLRVLQLANMSGQLINAMPLFHGYRVWAEGDGATVVVQFSAVDQDESPDDVKEDTSHRVTEQDFNTIVTLVSADNEPLQHWLETNLHLCIGRTLFEIYSCIDFLEAGNVTDPADPNHALPHALADADQRGILPALKSLLIQL